MDKDEILNSSDGEEETFSDDGDWGDWEAHDNGRGEEEDEGFESDFICLFCDSHYGSCDLFFEHCILSHGFDFHGVRKELNLDFYASFKLINYIRSQVAENKCWSWGSVFEAVGLKDVVKFPSDEEKYLKPFLQEDSLLYSFADDEEEEEEVLGREGVMEDLKKLGVLGSVDEDLGESSVSKTDKCSLNGSEDVTLVSNGNGVRKSFENDSVVNGKDRETYVDVPRFCNGRLVTENIRKVNENYLSLFLFW